MTNTENNVAAQAGDEPMRAAFENSKQYRSKLMFKRGGSVFAEDVPPGDYVDASAQAAWIFWQEAYKAGQVSPRATADVERDKGLEAAAALIDRKVNAYDDDMGSTDRETGAREYPGDGGEWVNEMSELAEEIRALKSVATTKPGA